MASKKATDEQTVHNNKSVFQFESETRKFDGQIIEKELVPWDSESDIDIELDEKQTGWDADDMFKQNESKYGVRTSYDPELKAYTMPLKKTDGKEYKDAEMEAGKLAHEIDNNAMHKARMSSENAEDGDSKGAKREYYVMLQDNRIVKSNLNPYAKEFVYNPKK